MALALPIFPLATPGQRYSCHGCGNCCRDFTVQLRVADVERLAKQGWTQRLGANPVVEFRGVPYLRQRADGACVFLREDGKCEVHAAHGFDEKPLACRMFPYMLAPEPARVRMGMSFACQSVLENKGAPCASQVAEAARIAREAPEAVQSAPRAPLARGLASGEGELEALERSVVGWIAMAHPIDVRLDGLAWLAESLLRARLERVRGERFIELVTTLVSALPDELAHFPNGPLTPRQERMLRSAIFARVEDPKPLAQGAPTRWRATLSQFLRHGAWKRGGASALVPAIGHSGQPRVRFGQVSGSAGILASADAVAIDELLTRWIRATVEGGRASGSGYYGWDATAGLCALVLNVACALWLARYRTVATGSSAPTLDDLRWALSRIDRTSGRAPWLGSWSERARLMYLVEGSGLRRAVAAGCRWRA